MKSYMVLEPLRAKARDFGWAALFVVHTSFQRLRGCKESPSIWQDTEREHGWWRFLFIFWYRQRRVQGAAEKLLAHRVMNQELGFKLLAYVDERACRCRASQHLTKDCNVLDLIPGNLRDDVLQSTERKVGDAGDSMSQSMG